MGRRHHTHRRKLERLDTRNWINALKLGDRTFFPLSEKNYIAQNLVTWRRQQTLLSIRTRGLNKIRYWSDPAEDLQEIIQFAVCPACDESYPSFHSPIGSLHTLCDTCGWSSEVDG